MFFALTDEQRALAATPCATTWPTASTWPPSAGSSRTRRRRRPGRRCGRPSGEQGWLAVTVPEEYDGLGLGLLDAAGHRPRARRGGRARAVAAAPCSPPRRSGWPAPTSRRRRGCPGSPPASGASSRRSAARAAATARCRRRPRRVRRRSPTLVVAAADGRGLVDPGATGATARLHDGTRPHHPAGARRARRQPARAARRDGGRADGPGRGARRRRPRRHRPRGAHPHGRLRPDAQAVRRAGRLVPGDQAHAGRPARRRDDGRARRALRRARRRRRAADDAPLAVAVAKAKAGDAAPRRDRAR